MIYNKARHFVITIEVYIYVVRGSNIVMKCVLFSMWIESNEFLLPYLGNSSF